HPVPAARAYVTASIATPSEAHEAVRALLATALAPAAIELDLPVIEATRSAHAEEGGGQITVLLEGTVAGVAARAREASTAMHGGIISADPPVWWGRYPFAPGDIALKIVAPVADLHAALYALRDAAGTAVSVRGSAGVGVCYAALPGTPPPGQ